jgi:hypothetical protein
MVHVCLLKFLQFTKVVLHDMFLLVAQLPFHVSPLFFTSSNCTHLKLPCLLIIFPTYHVESLPTHNILIRGDSYKENIILYLILSSFVNIILHTIF